MSMIVGVPSAQVDASGRFTINGVTPGRYLVNGSCPRPAAGPGLTWTLKSAVFKGRDVLDFPLEIGAERRDLRRRADVHRRDAAVTGTLQDADGPAGARLHDHRVRGRQAVLDAAGAAHPHRRGRAPTARFTVTNLPAGDYRIAAVVDIAPGDANDPAFLEQLVPARPVTLAEGERKVQDLRIAGVPIRPL